MLGLAVPAQVTLDIDTKVCDLGFLFKIYPHHGIAGISSVPLPRDSHDVTFAGIKFHSPCLSPVDQGVKIILQK